MLNKKDTSFKIGRVPCTHVTAKVTCTLKLPNRTEDDSRHHEFGLVSTEPKPKNVESSNKFRIKGKLVSNFMIF